MIVILSQPDLKTTQTLASLTLNPAVQTQTLFNPEPKPQVKAAPKVLPKPDEPKLAPIAPPANAMPVATKAVPLPAPVPAKPWEWQPLVDDVAARFRTDIPDTGGLPLLYMAVLQDDAEWISQLISQGASATEVTPGGDTPLCAAIRHASPETVRALLYGGADPTQMNFEKQPPIVLASLRRGSDILRALTAAGVDPNTRFASPVSRSVLERVMIKDLKHSLENDRGVTPLMACAARGDVEGAAELIRAGAKASFCTTRYKRYPINFAATQGYLFLMRIILGRQPESEPQILVTVNLTQQRAWVTQEGKIIDSCLVSTGREGFDTPAGRYVITDKHRAWTSTLYHVSMPFFMRLNCSAIGLHSGYVTGRPASHGCIRLPYEKAKKFFGLVGVGDEVQIVY
ncbi:ankyrin repeat protein [Prosthecobacter fusiformis]|uniref:Ankyrin repeat protein n=2 Tax=Prosthecobacter fusiformis TaxID=48464 RepID=A0A4R7RZK8_9BACT|nr:ankyrin repeat protein [Prosthecobacter fusiformis]